MVVEGFPSHQLRPVFSAAASGRGGLRAHGRTAERHSAASSHLAARPKMGPSSPAFKRLKGVPQTMTENYRKNPKWMVNRGKPYFQMDDN